MRNELELQRAAAEVNAYWGEAATQVEEYRITPYKKDIFLSVFGIGWQPNWSSRQRAAHAAPRLGSQQPLRGGNRTARKQRERDGPSSLLLLLSRISAA